MGRTCAINQVLGTDMKKHFDIVSRFQVGSNAVPLPCSIPCLHKWPGMKCHKDGGSCSTICGQRLEGRTAGHVSWLQRLLLLTRHLVLPMALRLPQPAPSLAICPTTGNTSSPANSAQYNQTFMSPTVVQLAIFL